MGLLDDMSRRGILNGATPAPGDLPPAPFGFGPTADGMIQQARAQLPAQPMPGFRMTSASDDSWQAGEARENLAASPSAPFGIPRPAHMQSFIETYRQATEPKPTAVEPDPFATAAARVRRGVQPIGGRREGDLTDTLSNIVPQAAESLVTIPQRAIEGSAADLPHFGNHDVPLQSVAPAVDAAMWTMGGTGVVPAEANSLRMGIKAYRGSPNKLDGNFDVLNVPYEAIPSRDSRHLAGIEKLPQDLQDKYSRSFNFGHGPGGNDTIYAALQPRTAPNSPMRQLPTLEAQGFWRLPDGSVQQNLANVARPLVGRAKGNPTKMDPESARITNVAENLRAYGSVQDGIGGQLMTPAGKVADTNTVNVPTPNGVTREQLAELNRRAKPYGLADISKAATST
jgi:hypothetical protein